MMQTGEGETPCYFVKIVVLCEADVLDEEWIPLLVCQCFSLGGGGDILDHSCTLHIVLYVWGRY